MPTRDLTPLDPARHDPAVAIGRRPPDAGLALFDCLAPFFRDHPGGTINWSKIPFAALEEAGMLAGHRRDALLADVEAYVGEMARLGFNAVAIDDLAHLVAHDVYPESLRARLAAYGALYRRLFATIKAHGLALFVVTDYLFANPAIDRYLHERRMPAAEFFGRSVEAAFAAYPEIDGIVLRIGESDGVDVAGDFKSRLAIRTPGEARALLQDLLPRFARWDKTLIVRTWTLGAYEIGDLIWNRATYDAIFAGIDAPQLVVSLKYGDADFFRYLALNPLFFHGPHRKLVELQCRREYEGMGEYPAFVGRDYAAYLAALRAGGCNLAGIYALQGGGWAPFRRLAFCATPSIWNELNTEVTIRLFRGETLAESVEAICRRRGIGAVEDFRRLLRLADEAIEEGLYIREFARQPLYFRRARVPPLIWVFWHNVTTGGLIGLVTRYLVRDRAAAVAEGHRAVARVEEMVRLARRLDLPEDGIPFQLDTFRILALLREVLLGLDTPATHERLRPLLTAYRARYPDGYRFDDTPVAVAGSDRRLEAVLPLLLRRRMAYRPGDRLLLNPQVSRLNRFVARRQAAWLPRFVDRQGMPTDILLR